MPDVRASSTLSQSAVKAGALAVEFYRYLFGYFALALFAGVITIASIPELRAQALAVHGAVVAAAKTDATKTPSKVLAAAAATDKAGAVIGDARPQALAHMPKAGIDSLGKYISDKYRVSRSAIGALVETAWDVGGTKKLDPLLLLAVMAIESSFDPLAESHVGAQGLMQVMTRIHRKKFEPFGGTKAAWRPDANIAVGAQILQDCIKRRGSIQGGLTCYVGSAGTTSAYGRKVLAEHKRLMAVLNRTDDVGPLVAINDTKPAAKPTQTAKPTRSAKSKSTDQRGKQPAAALATAKPTSEVTVADAAKPVSTFTEVTGQVALNDTEVSLPDALKM